MGIPILSDIASGLSGIFGGGGTSENDPLREALQGNATGARGFADRAQANYNSGTLQLNGAMQGLRDQASGKNSVSAEQLRQALMQNQAGQRSAAVSAAPRDSAMAARTAAIQSSRLGSALAGQQAQAGLQERNQAQQALMQGILGARGQDLQGTLGGYNASNQAYGASMDPNADKSWSERNAALLSAGASAAALSDERTKQNVTSGAPQANRLLDALKSYSFEYRPESRAIGGQGRQLGVMAQDVERAAPGVVTNTPAGKMVNGSKLAAAIAATLPVLDERLAKLERGKAK